MTITQTQTIYVDLVPFEATLWFDESDNTVDIEASASVQSQYLAYPGSSLVEVEANVYTVPIAEWDAHFMQVARDAIAQA
jgi:hypothetical protein